MCLALTRVGLSGTLYGETGWESDTGEAIWPWPHEARIKSEMCVGRTDGFCGAASLTTYICNYLGNSCSSDTQALTPPAGWSTASFNDAAWFSAARPASATATPTMPRC